MIERLALLCLLAGCAAGPSQEAIDGRLKLYMEGYPCPAGSERQSSGGYSDCIEELYLDE